jgi:predicted Zn-dependent peptidase
MVLKIDNLKTGSFKNGIKYIIDNNESASSVTILIMFKTGSRNEPINYFGISHFIEHLMFKGTQKRSKHQEIVNELYRYGAIINAFTDIDCTAYYVKIPPEHIDCAIDILSDMLFNSKFHNKDIELEKKVVLNELERSNTDVENQLISINHQILYENTLLAHDTGGIKKDIENYSRSMIMSYLENHYRLDNMVISLAGKVNQSVIKVMSKYFGNKKFTYKSDKSMINSNRIVYYPNFRNIQSNIRFNNIIREDLQQTYVCISVPTYGINDKRSYIVDIIGTILAGNMGSRLFLKMREKMGLVYTVSKSVDKFEDLGSLKIVFSTFNDQNKIKKCYQMVINEFNKMKANRVSIKELNMSKDFIIGKTKLSKENTLTVATFNAINQLFMDNPLVYNSYIEQYKKISVEDVYNISNEIFEMSKINISIISHENFL